MSNLELLKNFGNCGSTRPRERIPSKVPIG